ncbi:MAG TPA: 2-C-methyl-D-erythritol 4-phosphate cytidylyltransferase, partial [Caulobacteraceae bacterium]|nr:2-C-methyl-D-erythritol 4-phosphate cytidylyltransferase [Caulobacteraceae bacterium]
MKFSAVIVAAGSGTRAGAGAAKQWRLLAGKPVLRWSAEALLGTGAREVVVVVAEGADAAAVEALAGLSGWKSVTGGATRSKSV